MTGVAQYAGTAVTRDQHAANRWWESRAFLIAVALVSTFPLLWPEIPPLVDLPGHIGRYRVELDLNSSADLQRYYDFRWALIGNLGVDLLVVPLAPLLGLEPAVKLIVISTVLLTVGGIFGVARAVHGRVPPTALFAVPFIYSYPFNFGFLNFTLSIGLALLAFALWLRLSHPGKLRLRALVFAPLACALWIVHAFGWGLLGLLAFSTELFRYRDQGKSALIAARGAAMQMLPLSIPFALMILWHSAGIAGQTKTFFFLTWKLLIVASTLRDRWLVWDALGVGVALVVIGAGIFDRRLEFSRRLEMPAVALLGAFLALPFMFLGSAHADMRLAPYIIIIALVAVRFREPSLASESLLAKLGVAFLLCRLVGNTASFAFAAADMRETVRALDHVPRGAAVLTLTSGPCDGSWSMPRHWHLGALVIARKNGFSNDQWVAAGAQLLSVRYEAAEPFTDVRTAQVFSPKCAALLNLQVRRGQMRVRTTQQALNEFPRKAFDYVWLIKPPPGAFAAPADLVPIWRGPDTILFRVKRKPGRPAMPSSRQPSD